MPKEAVAALKKLVPQETSVAAQLKLAATKLGKANSRLDQLEASICKEEEAWDTFDRQMEERYQKEKGKHLKIMKILEDEEDQLLEQRAALHKEVQSLSIHPEMADNETAKPRKPKEGEEAEENHSEHSSSKMSDQAPGDLGIGPVEPTAPVTPTGTAGPATPTGATGDATGLAAPTTPTGPTAVPPGARGLNPAGPPFAPLLETLATARSLELPSLPSTAPGDPSDDELLADLGSAPPGGQHHRRSTSQVTRRSGLKEAALFEAHGTVAANLRLSRSSTSSTGRQNRMDVARHIAAPEEITPPAVRTPPESAVPSGIAPIVEVPE